MDISKYIENVLFEIGSGISSGNRALLSKGIGNVHYDGIGTLGTDLVDLRLAKDGNGEPIIVVSFDIKIAVEERAASTDAASIKASVPLLSVIGIGGSVEGGSEKGKTSNTVHSVTFSVPVKVKNQLG